MPRINKPTRAEILEEVAKLTAMKPNVLPKSRFGDDHHAAIDAQVEVLEKNLVGKALDTLLEEALDNEDDNILDAVHHADDWRDGTNPVAPSDDWKDLVRA